MIVSTKRTFAAASGYVKQKVAVHNFASSTNPGGGVTRGSSAQEECLCRCSGLYFCLSVPEMMKGDVYKRQMHLGQRFSVFMEIMRCGRKMQDVMNS